jgi:hypothetical protein
MNYAPFVDLQYMSTLICAYSTIVWHVFAHLHIWQNWTCVHMDVAKFYTLCRIWNVLCVGYVCTYLNVRYTSMYLSFDMCILVNIWNTLFKNVV